MKTFALCVSMFMVSLISVLAAEYDPLFKTDQESGTIVPVGKELARFVGIRGPNGWGLYRFCEISDKGIIIEKTAYWGNSGTSVIGTPLQEGEKSVFRHSTDFPAIRVEVLTIDIENGTARLKISTFWPQPNE
jgi:hypothetical protein